jgi:small-conductance mechanosensitive channel
MTFTEMLSNALGRIIAFIPNLLAALLILAVGLLVATLLGRATRRILDGIDLPRRLGRVIEKESVLQRTPHTFGRIVYWAVALITISLAIDALALTWLSAGLARVLGYLPSVLAAAAILVGAYLLGNYLRKRTARRQAEAGGEQPHLRILPDLLRVGIYVIAGFMALQELGVATTIVTSAFIISLGALSIAAAVAFGLGNRELAGRVTRDWYERRRSAREGRDERDEGRGGARQFEVTDSPPPLGSH